MPRKPFRKSFPSSSATPAAEPAPEASLRPAGRSLRAKFFAGGIVLLLTVLTTILLFLPFLNHELDQQIRRQQGFHEENIRQEAETIARLLVFDLSRLDELWDILYQAADLDSEREIVNRIRTYLWEKVTFNRIIRDIELLDDSGVVRLRPFSRETSAEQAQRQLPADVASIDDYLGITAPAYRPTEEAVYVFMPLYIDGYRWGVVKIAVSTELYTTQLERQAAEQDRFRWLTGVFFLGTLALSGAVALLVLNLLARKITEPLKLLSLNVELFAERGDTSRLQRVDVEDDEVGLLAQNFSAMANDINRLLEEKDEAYEKLKESQEQLRQSEKLATLGQLSGGIAHEINNALSPIRLRAEEVLLTQEEGGVAQKDDLRVILKGIEQCSAIVSKLRDFASPALGERSPVDLNDVVCETVALVRRQIEKRRIRLELNLAARPLPPINASALELEQVFMNLLLNARDAIDSAGDGGSITITTGADDGIVWAVVEDDGVGMDARTRQRVFEPFFTTKPIGQGTGLGLSVSFGILQSHGASIEIASEPGRGTSVKVSFLQDRTSPGDRRAVNNAQ